MNSYALFLLWVVAMGALVALAALGVASLVRQRQHTKTLDALNEVFRSVDQKAEMAELAQLLRKRSEELSSTLSVLRDLEGSR